MENTIVPTGRTEKGALAHESTFDKNLDLFVKLVRTHHSKKAGHRMLRRSDVTSRIDTLPNLYSMLRFAWMECAMLVVKIIFQTRDPRNGKGERALSYRLLRWLKHAHPKTYRIVMNRIPEFGRFDDWLALCCDDDDYELQLFANQLQTDLTVDHPSLAAKWAPREGTSTSALAKRLARIMFPNDRACMKRYRKEIISPLMQKLDVVEVKMCASKFGDINYEHVPAGAMHQYGKDCVGVHSIQDDESEKKRPGAFLRQDNERFVDYRAKVKEGKAKIHSTGIQPHQLVKTVWNNVSNATAELQWTALLTKLAESGKLQNAISIVDVSGSMDGEPIEVAISLGLVIASLSEGHYHNKVITFSESPSLFDVLGTTLSEKVNCLQMMPWGNTTNFQSAYQLILNSAKFVSLPKEQMPKTLFVFTDMQFDSASESAEETLFQSAKREFEAAGYELPRMVFWNLRASETGGFPVTASQTGTAYVSGFSSVLLKVFMDGIDFTPMSILHALLDKYPGDVDASEVGVDIDVNENIILSHESDVSESDE